MKKFQFLFFIPFIAGSLAAQTEASVPYQSLLGVNPSFAGSNGFIRNQTFSNLQSTAYGNYYTIENGFDGYLSSIKSGVGLTTGFSNYNNIFRTSTANLSFARYIKIGERLKIIPSLQAGYVIKEINMGYFSTSMYKTPGSNSQWVRAEHFTLGTGLLINYNNLYFGASLIDFNRPDIGIFNSERSYPIFNLHVSYNMRVSDNLRLHFYGQATSQVAYRSQLLSLNALIYKHLIYGVSYRPRDVFAMNAGFRTTYFTAQACLNRTISALRPDNSKYYYWQIMLSFNLRNKEQRNLITNFEAW